MSEGTVRVNVKTDVGVDVPESLSADEAAARAERTVLDALDADESVQTVQFHRPEVAFER